MTICASLLSWSLWYQSRFNIRFQRSKPNNHTASIFSLHLSAVRKCSVSHFQLKTAWVMIVQFANHFLTLCLELVKEWATKSQPSYSQILRISPVKDKITEPTNFFSVAIFEVGHPNESNGSKNGNLGLLFFLDIQGRKWLPKTGWASSNAACRHCLATAPSILPKTGRAIAHLAKLPLISIFTDIHFYNYLLLLSWLKSKLSKILCKSLFFHTFDTYKTSRSMGDF